MRPRKIRNMEEFAAVSGISRPTVSKYFNNPDSVRASTRERIERALKRYEFQPNIFAINQNRQLTRFVGVLVPHLADPVFGEIARNLERKCIEAGYRALVFSSHGEQRLENQALDSLRALRPSGVLLAPLGRFSDRDHILRFCEEVPTVLFDRDIEGVGEAFVGSDNTSFVSQSVEYLVRTGESPCFFEMKEPSNPNSLARRSSYARAMEAHGLEPVYYQVAGKGWELEEIGYQGALRALSDRTVHTNTFLCSNDRLAVGFLAAAFEKGLRVGRGVGFALRVAGHDDHPSARYACPPLTTVAHEYDALSKAGTEVLFKLIDEGGRFERRSETLLPARLVLRLSA